MRFYRIEADNGDGPYSGGIGLGQFNDQGAEHPSPQEDGLMYDDFYDRKFGFVSFEQALEWFTDEMLDWLAAEPWKGRSFYLPYKGFALSVYKVDEKEVRRGGRQAVASLDTLEPVERISLNELKQMRKGGPEWTTNDRPSMTSVSISNEPVSSETKQASERLYIMPSDSTGKSPTWEPLSRGDLTGLTSGFSFSEISTWWTTDLTA